MATTEAETEMDEAQRGAIDVNAIWSFMFVLFVGGFVVVFGVCGWAGSLCCKSFSGNVSTSSEKASSSNRVLISHSRGMSGIFSENVIKESSPFNHALFESR